VPVIILYFGCVSGGLIRSRDFAITHYLKTRASIRIFWTMYPSILSYLLSYSSPHGSDVHISSTPDRRQCTINVLELIVLVKDNEKIENRENVCDRSGSSGKMNER